MAAPTSFLPFPRLPVELRLEIWKYCAVVEPQVVPFPLLLTLGNWREMGYNPPPKLMLVNRESHAVALKTYRIRLVVSHYWAPRHAYRRWDYLGRRVYRLAPYDRIVHFPTSEGVRNSLNTFLATYDSLWEQSVEEYLAEFQGYPRLASLDTKHRTNTMCHYYVSHFDLCPSSSTTGTTTVYQGATIDHDGSIIGNSSSSTTCPLGQPREDGALSWPFRCLTLVDAHCHECSLYNMPPDGCLPCT
ncbi:hypothetical protein PGQ11_001145 [Apiospora arundinis]|uniref:2EXR domain-containing protein n=1 Tax=Apiospora arundinis TaxID=335852 RepID=A0ABR2JLY4_9PEZI